MKAYTIDAGSHTDLAVVEDDGLVYVIGEGYITIWKSLDDFHEKPDQPIRTIEIACREVV